VIKQTAIRLPTDLAAEIDYVARVRQVSANSLIIDAVRAFLQEISSDPEFAEQAQVILENEKEILQRILKPRR
jgi:metal-responsive CopG/Arc/MetJ family transcriptional regulator